FAGKQYRKSSVRHAENREYNRRKREKEQEMRDRHRKEVDEFRRKQRERELENEERFAPVVGIGDNTIREETDERPTVFVDTQGSTVRKPNSQYSSYQNAPGKTEGITIKGIDKKPERKDDIPEFDIDEDFFDEHDGYSVPKPAGTAANTPAADPDDRYTKTVITANGKVMNVETDGDILGKKTVYQGSVNNPVSNGAGSAVKVAQKTAAQDGPAESVVITKPVKEPTKEYRFPPMRLLHYGAQGGSSKEQIQAEIRETAEKLQQTLAIFGVGATVTHVSYGPAVTRYELQPELGVKVSRILALADDIKLSLAAADIRIEAPIPGKSAIGIEVPNKVTQSVVLRDLLESDEFRNTKSKLAFPAGKDIEGNIIVADIAKMPHVLVAGATGSGKSVCINTLIMSILYHAKPTEVKMIMVDPKVVELSGYNGIPHLLMPVVTDPKKAASALNWAVAEMERRYELFAQYSVRSLEGFNTLIETDQIEENDKALEKLPQILIIVDELADLMMVSPKEVEASICRLAQKARAAGLHLVLATQRPSVDVITGLIKANIPSRIAFAVSSGVDSRTILDMNGAERLLGRGDMLYDPAGAPKPLRVQGAFVSDREISDVVEYIQNQGPVKGMTTAAVDLNAAGVNGAMSGGNGNDRDEYFADAGRLVIEKEKASIGMLQRAFKLGFNRAARIMDQLGEAGVVGEEEGTKPRRVIMSMAEFEQYLSSGK
ncbi:MAG: DNA translocase FtsK, partial [Lachnospiraceae bacterium]|nr:DNA translocase FtsK [Lachnospiraceae bacterium]